MSRRSEQANRRRTNVHHYTASQQLAIEFVLRNLANPAGVRQSNWRQPIWCGFIWFTKIMSRAMRMIRVDKREYGEIELLETQVFFKLGVDDVVIITLLGERSVATAEYPTPSVAWAIHRVQYRLRWETGHDDGEWVDEYLGIRSFSGLPPKTSPIG